MNPAIVIPTYWSTNDRLGNPGSTYCYDHATPIDKATPELEGCLASLEQVVGLTHVILLVVAPPEIEERVVHRVSEIASSHNLPDVVIVDSFKAGFLADMFQDKLPHDIGEPIGLRGYGAIRNMGLLACCALGCDLAVFVDDDEVILDPDFLANAAYGIGAKPRSGVPVMAKSGYFLDRRNSALADRRQVPSYDKHWAKRQEFNQWMTQALAGPRISRSNTVCGGCFSVHAEAFTRVAFDPWITRGEDLDYMFNLRFYGMDVWFDNRWRVRHIPPRIKDTAFRFQQDAYRWVYERRKIEIGNSHIDLHKLSPDMFMPYPGPWIGPELPKRIKKTALRRTIQTKEHLAYFKIWRNVIKDATDYAEQNCTRYLEFQAYWNNIATDAWRNEAMEHILRAEGMLNPTVAERMAKRNGVVPQPYAPAEQPKDDSVPPAQAAGAAAGGFVQNEQDFIEPIDDPLAMDEPYVPAGGQAPFGASMSGQFATGTLEPVESAHDTGMNAAYAPEPAAAPVGQNPEADYRDEYRAGYASDITMLIDPSADFMPVHERSVVEAAPEPVAAPESFVASKPAVAPAPAAEEKLDGSIPAWMLAQATAAQARAAARVEEVAYEAPVAEAEPPHEIDPEVAEKLDAEADEIFQTMVMPAVGAQPDEPVEEEELATDLGAAPTDPEVPADGDEVDEPIFETDAPEAIEPADVLAEGAGAADQLEDLVDDAIDLADEALGAIDAVTDGDQPEEQLAETFDAVVEHVGDQADELFDTAVEQVENQADDVVDAVADQAAAAVDTVEQAAEQAEDAAELVAEEAQEAVADLTTKLPDLDDEPVTPVIISDDPLEAAVELAAGLVPGADPDAPQTFATSVMPVVDLVDGAVPDPNADDTLVEDPVADNYSVRPADSAE